VSLLSGMSLKHAARTDVGLCGHFILYESALGAKGLETIDSPLGV